jgi:hypothetical protein
MFSTRSNDVIDVDLMSHIIHVFNLISIECYFSIPKTFLLRNITDVKEETKSVVIFESIVYFAFCKNKRNREFKINDFNINILCFSKWNVLKNLIKNQTKTRVMCRCMFFLYFFQRQVDSKSRVEFKKKTCVYFMKFFSTRCEFFGFMNFIFFIN